MKPEDVAAAGLQAAVNRVIALDPELAEGLAGLDGAIVEIEVHGLGRRVQLHVTGAGVAVVAVGDPETAPAPDLVIRGPAFTLLRLAGSLESVDGVMPPEVTISGDLQLLQSIARIAKRAHLDWEEPLARVLGDSLAHEIGRGMRGIAAHLRAVSDTLGRDMGEYLQEESRISPTRLELEDFSAAVDRIRDDVERMEARLSRLATGGGSR